MEVRWVVGGGSAFCGGGNDSVCECLDVELRLRCFGCDFAISHERERGASNVQGFVHIWFGGLVDMLSPFPLHLFEWKMQ